MSPTDRLLAFAADPPAIPAAVREAAADLVVDTLAVGEAGRTAAEGVLAAARRWGAGDAVPLLGCAERLPAPSAAFVNAFQIHALEWDAVHEPGVVHALSVVTAVVHALCHAAAVPVREAEALDALVVGVEIACALGVAATGPMRFFRPATAGLMGAALAGARVARLPAAGFADVLGLAHAQCAGTMQAHVEGSVALPLQIAHAARAAVTAVDLVRAGLSGPHDVLEGRFGYFPLFEEGDLGAVADTLGRQWRTPEISFKPWPCGRASHGVLGALEGVADVAAIEANVPPLVLRLVGRPMDAAMTAAWARLSLPFLAALMLADGHIDPRRFTAERFADPALRALGARLTLLTDGNPDPNALGPQRVLLSFADGRNEERPIAATPGSPGHPANARLAAAKLALAQTLAGTATPPTLAMLAGAS